MMYWCPRSMHLHTEIYPNVKSISEFFKMYMKSIDSFISASCNNWVSCNQTLDRLCPPLRRVSRAQPRINANKILLQHDWLFLASCFWNKRFFYFTDFEKLFFYYSLISNNIFNILPLLFSRHNRFAETHRYFQLSYQITDRVLATRNEQV